MKPRFPAALTPGIRYGTSARMITWCVSAGTSMRLTRRGRPFSAKRAEAQEPHGEGRVAAELKEDDIVIVKPEPLLLVPGL